MLTSVSPIKRVRSRSHLNPDLSALISLIPSLSQANIARKNGCNKSQSTAMLKPSSLKDAYFYEKLTLYISKEDN